MSKHFFFFFLVPVIDHKKKTIRNMARKKENVLDKRKKNQTGNIKTC